MSVEELLQAVNDGDESTAKRLVRGGVSPSDGCKRQVRAAHGIVRMFPVGTTGLHVAAYAAHTELLRFMLGHTKNLAPEDTNGATPLQIAMATGRASLNKITRVNSMESAKALVHGGSMMRLADWMGLHIERGSIGLHFACVLKEKSPHSNSTHLHSLCPCREPLLSLHNRLGA